MSIVTPIPQQTTIKAYKAPAWDDRLLDIRLFETDTERQSYLQGLWIKTWNNCSVQRTGRSIRVEASINEMLECGYISWINTGLPGDPITFYAWVTSVDYVNVNTVEISFEVDWIQTYLFEFSFDGCFIEREHVLDDVYGKYVLPEDLNTGEYIVTDTSYWFPETPYTAVVAQTLASTYNIVPGGMVTGLESTAYLSNVEGIADFQLFLNRYTTTPERVVSIFMCVANMVGAGHTAIKFTDGVSVPHTTQIDGYTPHNQKTLQYPFQFLSVDNFNGMTENYRWEENTATAPGQPYPPMQFQVNGSPVPKPHLEIFPTYYKHGEITSALAPGATNNGYNQIKVTYDDFPSVPYATDSYRAWVSEFGHSFAVNQQATLISGGVNMFGGVVSAMRSVKKGNVVGLASSIAGTINSGMNTYNQYTQQQQEKESHQIHSQQLHGTVSSSGFNFDFGRIGFRITQYSAKGEQLKRIDNYFDQFGYRVDRVGVPNIRGRQYFNYVKCAYADVSCPNEDAKLMMERAMMQGCWFWHVNNINHSPGQNPVIGS